MKQSMKIQEAIKMVKAHDWYWMMADYGYVENRNNAEADMRVFVKLVNTIEDETIREQLRTLWVLNHSHASKLINGNNDDDFEKKQVEILKALAS